MIANVGVGLVYGLQAAALAQLSIAVLNLFLVRLMKWRDELGRVTLLVREVFQVHAWFISVTLTIFAILTWHFAAELSDGANPLGRWLAAGIGGFWALRTILQITYYSTSHWRGRANRTAAHLVLLVVYASFAAVYLLAAFRTVGGTS